METKNDVEAVVNDELFTYAIHPGSILKDELRARGIKQKDFAESIGMKATHLSALIHGVRNISAGIAAKLEKGLDIPARMWMSLQNDYNINKKKQEDARPSSFVAGYGVQNTSFAALREPEFQDNYGLKETIVLTIPSKDKELLIHLASRMGWNLTWSS